MYVYCIYMYIYIYIYIYIYMTEVECVLQKVARAVGFQSVNFPASTHADSVNLNALFQAGAYIFPPIFFLSVCLYNIYIYTHAHTRRKEKYRQVKI
jgi:hypothetical protein